MKILHGYGFACTYLLVSICYLLLEQASATETGLEKLLCDKDIRGQYLLISC